MGGNGSGNSSFVAINVVVSLHSLVNIAWKEEKENEKQRGTNKNKEIFFGNWGTFKKWEKKVPFPFQYKEALWVIYLQLH